MDQNEAPEPPMFSFLITLTEAVVLGAAVTTYQRQADRDPEQDKKRQGKIKLLERFQRRLVQQLDHGLPSPIEVELQKLLAKRKKLR
jgi:hypothetical protein